MSTEVNNTDSTIYSLDVIARIEELKADIDILTTDIGDNQAPDDFVSEREDLEDAREDLRKLEAFADQAAGSASDWNYGETAIHSDHFTDYAEELVRDIGDLPRELPSYIESNIDWEGVALALKADYTEVDFDGETYYIR